MTLRRTRVSLLVALVVMAIAAVAMLLPAGATGHADASADLLAGGQSTSPQFVSTESHSVLGAAAAGVTAVLSTERHVVKALHVDRGKARPVVLTPPAFLSRLRI